MIQVTTEAPQLTVPVHTYKLLTKQEIRSVELGVCPMQLFNFLSRDVHPVQNLLLCIQKFIEIVRFFTELWRYIDFQNGGRPPSWNCLPPYETTHEVSVAGSSCLSNFM